MPITVRTSLFLAFVSVVFLPFSVASIDAAPPEAAANAEPVHENDTTITDTRRWRDTEQRVTIRIYSSIDIAADVVRAASSIVDRALASARINIDWKVCKQVGCDTPLGAHELAVHMSRDPEGDRPGVTRLGYAAIDAHTHAGSLATVYIDRVHQVARDLDIELRVLLGRVMAHEIGHLLKASNTHGASGLMREIWSREELMRTRAEDWVLHPRDAAEIRSRLAQVRPDRPRAS